ncbi:hypothetical protein EDD22DRAFT_957218 [Suillus occidentalis]|nr:hypothetical protein EDD22DRAFT_957218 [Suillus occidentalis]
MELIPPFWMRAGLQHFTFHDVLESRLQTLGNWAYYQSLIQPYWHDSAILQGLEKMFNIFMSKEMVHAVPGEGFQVSLDFNHGLRHDELIDIVNDILIGMGSDVDYLYTTDQKMKDLRNNGRKRYETLLRYSQLPAVHDPNDNLADNPVTIPPERRSRPPSVNVSDISYVAPPLQGSESGFSIISSGGEQQLHSSPTMGYHEGWVKLSTTGAKGMFKHNAPTSRDLSHAHTYPIGPSHWAAHYASAKPLPFINMSSDHFEMASGPSAKRAPADDAAPLPKRRKKPAAQGEPRMGESGGASRRFRFASGRQPKA